MYYVCKNEIGIHRVKSHSKFEYFYANGKKVKNHRLLKRIGNLKIPPGYSEVWICSSSLGHIQAYGFDNKGRKQYIYNYKWQEQQNKRKFEHLITFGRNLPRLRRVIAKHLKINKLSKKKVIATVVKILDTTPIRIGSPQYESFGLLTLRKKHLTIKGSKISFNFAGKSGINWHLEINNKKIVTLLRHFEKNPGYTLIKYIDNHKQSHTLTVLEINNYLKKYNHNDTTAKDFRTWKASVMYLNYLLQSSNDSFETYKKICIQKVAHSLINTPKVCQNSYIHPLLLHLTHEDIRTISKIKLNNNTKNLFKSEKLLLFVLRTMS